MIRNAAFAVALLAPLYWSEYSHGHWDPAGQQVEFRVLLEDTIAAAKLDSIVAIEVVWPRDEGRTTLPLELPDRGDGVLFTETRLDSSEGLAFGTYTLVVRFEGGAEATRDVMYNNAWRLGGITETILRESTDWVSLRWNGPVDEHDWSARLERRDPGPVEPVRPILSGHGVGGGGQSVGFSHAFQAGETYALVVAVENDYTRRSYVHIFQRN